MSDEQMHRELMDMIEALNGHMRVMHDAGLRVNIGVSQRLNDPSDLVLRIRNEDPPCEFSVFRVWREVEVCS